jgi:hypothetical protein
MGTIRSSLVVSRVEMILYKIYVLLASFRDIDGPCDIISRNPLVNYLRRVRNRSYDYSILPYYYYLTFSIILNFDIFI